MVNLRITHPVDPFGSMLAGFREAQKDSYDKVLKGLQIQKLRQSIKLAGSSHARADSMAELKKQLLKIKTDNEMITNKYLGEHLNQRNRAERVVNDESEALHAYNKTVRAAGTSPGAPLPAPHDPFTNRPRRLSPPGVDPFSKPATIIPSVPGATVPPPRAPGKTTSVDEDVLRAPRMPNPLSNFDESGEFKKTAAANIFEDEDDEDSSYGGAFNIG